MSVSGVWACALAAAESKHPAGTTLTEGGQPSNYLPSPPPAIASLEPHKLQLSTVTRFRTTPDDVVPGHCLRLHLDVPRAGKLSVEGRSISDAPLAALFLGQHMSPRCPNPDEAWQYAAAESAPRAGFVALDTCVHAAGEWLIYASGSLGAFSTFNVTATLGDRCVAGATSTDSVRSGAGWHDPAAQPATAGPVNVLTLALLAVLTLALLAALALVFSKRKRVLYKQVL